MRGFLGRRRANEQYVTWVIQNLLKKVQARFRGVLERKKWMRRRLAALQKRAATAIAAASRGFRARRMVARLRACDETDRRDEVCTVSPCSVAVSLCALVFPPPFFLHSAPPCPTTFSPLVFIIASSSSSASSSSASSF